MFWMRVEDDGFGEVAVEVFKILNESKAMRYGNQGSKNGRHTFTGWPFTDLADSRKRWYIVKNR